MAGPVRLPARVEVAVGFGVDFLEYLSEENVVGILGMDALNHHSAIIDAARGVMYTIDPWDKEKGLVGEWKAVSVVNGGQEATAEYVASVELRLDNGKAKFTAANYKSEQVFDIDFVRTTGDVRAFNWYSGERNTPWRLIYKLNGDELVICCPFTFTDPKKMGRPTEFKSTKENEHALFTFKRVKAEKK
jgi:uncharacterized protein (TIGR03067 family)